MMNKMKNMMHNKRHNVMNHMMDQDKRPHLKKRNKVGLSILSLLMAASLTVGGLSTFATEQNTDVDTETVEGTVQILVDTDTETMVADSSLEWVSEPPAADMPAESVTETGDVDAAGSDISADSVLASQGSGDAAQTGGSVNSSKLQVDIVTDHNTSPTRTDDTDANESGDRFTADGHSDDAADVETVTEWESILPAELTGVWADDLITVAESQLGYRESTSNYRVNEAGQHKGYTRYGAWYGDPYGDWCAMFVSFCLHYTDIPRSEFPEAASCWAWTKTLDKLDMYEEADSGYEPVPGDLIFFDNNSKNEKPVDHVGIVTEIAEETDEETGEPVTVVKTIEGNSGNMVREREYDITDSRIVGYGVLPENPDPALAEENSDIDPIDTLSDDIQEYASDSDSGSDIFILMGDSTVVEAGSVVAFIVQAYDELTDTWSPASGVKYVTMDGYLGGYDTSTCTATSDELETYLDGQIVLTKTDDGYPYIHFTEDTVYANVVDPDDGALRIIESSLGTDASWGRLSTYGKDGWVGTAPSLANADTIYNVSDTNLTFRIEKAMYGGAESDSSFTFYLIRVTSASELPLTSLDQIRESAVGSYVSYTVYEADGTEVGTDVTTWQGTFTLQAGQYAVFDVPEDTIWVCYEGVNPGYTLKDLTTNGAENATIVDDVNAVVQNAHPVSKMGTLILTLTDSEDGTPLSGAQFDLYQDGQLYQSGLTTDANGQIIVEGCVPGEYYFEETAAGEGYQLPDPATSDTVTVSDNLKEVTEYTVNMKNTPAPVKYAVKIWGICTDTYSYDDGETIEGTPASLTFGPATGANYVTSYASCSSATCIHKLSWDEIIAYCEQYQGNEAMLTSLFGSCLSNGCTKSVVLTANDTLFNMTTVTNYRNQNYTGDGVSVLAVLLNGTGSALGYQKSAVWNATHQGYSSVDQDPANIYSRSRIRTTLTGDKSNIDEWFAEHPDANDYYGYDTLCDESNCLFSCLPANLQAAIVPRTTLNTGYRAGDSLSANDKTTYDTLFLFSLGETGYYQEGDDGGGEDYGVNPTNNSRRVYEFSGTGAASITTKMWWTRSRGYFHGYSAHNIGEQGAGDDYNQYEGRCLVSNNMGIAFGFSIK